MDNLRLWHKFLQLIKPLVGPDNFKAYFIKTLLKSLDGDNIVLSTNSAFIKESLDQKYKTLIEATFEKLLEKQVQVSFIVKESEAAVQTEEDFFQPQQSQTSQLNSKYTLEN